jgi:hypothetical protein
MKRAYWFLIICIAFSVFSCAMFDDVSDVSVSVNLPNEIIISNNASVSTLTSIDGEIIRSGTSVYKFHFNVDIPSGNNETVRIDDFIMLEGDKPRVTKADFTWSM